MTRLAALAAGFLALCGVFLLHRSGYNALAIFAAAVVGYGVGWFEAVAWGAKARS